MKTFKNRVSYYFRFTLLFLITALIIYAPYLVLKKSLVWEHDSYTQHLKAMIFISRWYRQSLRALISGNWKAISTYSFTFGYGSDALTTLAYYGVGDPFYLLSVLVPARYIYLFYSFLIVFKNYLSGIVFSALCRSRWPEKAHDGGILAGSLIYTFCGFVLITCMGQPIFLDAIIVFPLVLLGIEKVRAGQKPWLFILAIMLATVSNFYFLLSIVLMAVIYALFRYFPIEKGALGRRFGEIGTMFAAGTVGVSMGGVILLPMILTVLGNKRVDMKPAVGLFYRQLTCRNLPAAFLACEEIEYGALSYAGTALLCVFLLFLTKGYLKQKLQFLLYTVLLFVPAFGYLTNGFAYPINRWCWAYSAMIGMLVAEMWPLLFEMTPGQKRKMTFLLALYFVVCYILSWSVGITFLIPMFVTTLTLVCLLQSQRADFPEPAVAAPAAAPAATDPASAVQAAAPAATDPASADQAAAPAVAANAPADDKDSASAARAAARNGRRFRRAKRCILYLTIAGICANGICKNSPDYSIRVSTYKEQKYLAMPGPNSGASPANDRNLWINDTSQIAASIGHDTTQFERVSNTQTDYWYQNSSILNGISSTQSFWSINNPYILEFLDKLAVSDANNNAWQFTNLDNRAVLNELASVSFLYSMDPVRLPTGYEETSLDPTTANSVYPNRMPLPLGYTYRKTISREKFEALSPAERQEILLTHAVLDNPGVLEDKASPESLASSLECRKVPFTVVSLSPDAVQTDDNTFVVTAPEATVMLSFDKLTGGECYLQMKNTDFRETNKAEIYSDDPAFDANNLYTKAMWDNDVTLYEKYMLYRSLYNNRKAGNVKIKAEFYSGSEWVDENTVNFIVPDNEQYYSGRRDFLLNSYTLRKGIDSIVLTFPTTGVYHFDEFSLIHEPLTSYETNVAALSAESLQNTEIRQDPSSFVSTGVTGDITVSENKLLCLTIPYSEGWKAYVDGEPAVLENVNIMFSGLMLSPGHHTIELRYETPGFLYGICLTAAGILLFLLWLILSIRPNRRRRRPAPESVSEPDVSDNGPAPDGDEIPEMPQMPASSRTT